MYTGRMIEELFESVERAEQHASAVRAVRAADADAVKPDVHQVRDTFIYNFSYNQGLVGVA